MDPTLLIRGSWPYYERSKKLFRNKVRYERGSWHATNGAIGCYDPILRKGIVDPVDPWCTPGPLVLV